jgi:hypothetical protein
LTEVPVPNITMLEVDDLLETDLAGFVKKCLRHRAPDPAFHAMQGHNQELSKALYVAWGTVFNTGTVDHTLKEIIRIQLSRAASCNY